MKPCPCGYLGEIQRYRAGISGPLLDRVDIHIQVPAVPYDKLRAESEGESTTELRKHVVAAQKFQLRRQNCLNKDLNIRSIERHCALNAQAQSLLNRSMEQLGLSARAHHRIVRLARTIADLAACEDIETVHVSEAIQLRCLDRRN